MTSEAASPEQLEREIAKTRADIDATLSEIQERLSPQRAANRVLHYTMDNSGAFAGNLVHTLRDNPVPAVLVGIGLGWMMIAGGQSAPRMDSAQAGSRRDSGDGLPSTRPAATRRGSMGGSLGRFAVDNPLIVAALGIAAGTALGVVARAGRRGNGHATSMQTADDERPPEAVTAPRTVAAVAELEREQLHGRAG